MLKFLRSRAGAAAVLAFVVIFSTLFGSHRSLAAEAGKITAQNENVKKDLETRWAVGSNLYTVAGRYLDTGKGAIALEELSTTLGLARASETKLKEDAKAVMGTLYQDQLLDALDGVLAELEHVELSAQDAQYVSGFRAQLESISYTLAHDPYNEGAAEFNATTLGSFPPACWGR